MSERHFQLDLRQRVKAGEIAEILLRRVDRVLAFASNPCVSGLVESQ